MPAAAENAAVEVAHRLLEEYMREIVHESYQGKAPIRLEDPVQASGIGHELSAESDLDGRRTEMVAPDLGCGKRECLIARRPQEHELVRGWCWIRSGFAVSR